ncbi:ABC transporter substrate-binding protein [Pseudogemmobacter bohemicus]|uniref:ABC transporter substrate-binding protein n=1 Tax=Pseudogemmobacter bohemicus TaxID=2250708 RepID=UPI000DD449A2|nr:ABC transporter substrate-binding protein [Pseudogemmobacter bohemicus]
MKNSGKISKFGKVLAMGAAMTMAGAAAQARDLTVVSFGGNFQDAQRELFFKPFAALTGKPVLDEAWEGGYGVLQAKVKAGTPNWDVVQVEAEELALGCADGIYEKLDWEKLGGQDSYIEGGATECGAGHIVWSVAIAYDGNKLTGAQPTSWADFWDVEKIPGKRALRKSAKYALEAALMADGVSGAEVYDVLATPEGVDRAFAKLDELRPNLVWWEAGAQPLSMLQTGDVVMASVYNGRITGLNRTEGTNLKLVWNQSIYAVDSWVILAGAENKDAGNDFIAFANAPENLSKLPEQIAYGLPVKAAAELIPAEYAVDLPTYPDNLAVSVNLDVDYWVDNSEELTERFNAWVAQ